MNHKNTNETHNFIASFVISLLLVAAAVVSANASVSSFTNRSFYSIAAGSLGTTKTIDFSQRENAQPITSPGSDVFFSSIFLKGADFQMGRSYYNAMMYTFPNARIRVNLPANTYAFGVDMTRFYGTNGNFTVTLSTGDTYTLPGTPGVSYFTFPPNPNFLGFTSDEPVQWAEYSFSSDYLVLDNFTYTVNTPNQLSGLVSYWSAENSAVDVKDGNDGILRGGTAFAPGKIGQAFSFDGVSRYVEVPDSANLSLTGPMTLEAKIRLNSNTLQQSIIEKYDVPGLNGYLLRVVNGKLQAAMCSPTLAGAQQAATGATTVSPGVWHHVAAVYDGTTIKIYLDGVLDGSVISSIAPTDGSASLKIGARGDDAATRLNGLMDDVRIYNRALSEEEIQALSAEGSNTAPAAVGDSYSTDEDAPLSILANGVLGNDSDAENDALSAVLVSGPANASAFTLNPDGSFSYLPTADFNGTDSFTYKANDGQADSAEATVSITVNAVNDAPSLGNVPLSATTDELVAYNFSASANDIDNAGQTLTFSLVGAPDGAAIDPASGQFSWTPTEAQGPGTFSFAVRVSDGALNTDADISLTVNEVNAAPTLSNVPPSATIDELSAYAFTAASADADVPAQTLTFSLVGAPAGAGIDPASGQFSWTPSEAQGDGSTYSFAVRVSDGVAQTDSPIALTVAEVNSAPVLAAIADQTIDEETALAGVAASATDSDDPANALTYSLDAAPTGMTIDASTGAISWTPTETQGAGDYPVTVKVTDNGTGNLSDTKSFSVRVNEVNLAPVLNAIGSATIDEAVPFAFTASATDADLPANALTYSLVNAPAGAAIDPATGQFNWTPTEAQGGNPNTPYTFTVRVTDDGAEPLFDEETITLTVREVNTAPVLNAITVPASVNWGSTLSFTAAAVDGDDPANALTFSLVNAPGSAVIHPQTGQFSWTPAAGEIGAQSFTVKVTDNGNPALDDTQIISISVAKRPTALVYTGDAGEQYSDRQALAAILTDNGGGALQGSAVAGRTIGFAIGSQNASGTTDNTGTAAAELILTQDPAPNYNVVSSFAGDALFQPSSDSDAFDITPEDARVYYTGALYATANSAGGATLTLSATIRDITAEGSDPATDPFAGDITKATVDFVNRDNNTVVCANRPVGLVTLGDSTVGAATCNWNASIGSSDAASFTIGIVVKNYYTRNNPDDYEVVTVAKSAPGLITGGGYLLMATPTLSSGLYPGAAGTKTNFGFNIKNETKKMAPKGSINVIVRNGGRVYQIKGNAMTSLGTQPNSTGGKATFNGKASIQDITDPLSVIAIDGNATLQVTLTDNGSGGDLIGITVWNKQGGVWYASRWDGIKTVEQILGGGNLVVR